MGFCGTVGKGSFLATKQHKKHHFPVKFVVSCLWYNVQNVDVVLMIIGSLI